MLKRIDLTDSLEKIPVQIFPSPKEGSIYVANIIANLIKEKNYRVVNIDSSICLEMPKIKKHSDEMRNIIASILEVSIDDISIKATTTEKMGFAGREEGLVAHAVVLLQKIS